MQTTKGVATCNIQLTYTRRDSHHGIRYVPVLIVRRIIPVLLSCTCTVCRLKEQILGGCIPLTSTLGGTRPSCPSCADAPAYIDLLTPTPPICAVLHFTYLCCLTSPPPGLVWIALIWLTDSVYMLHNTRLVHFNQKCQPPVTKNRKIIGVNLLTSIL